MFSRCPFSQAISIHLSVSLTGSPGPSLAELAQVQVCCAGGWGSLGRSRANQAGFLGKRSGGWVCGLGRRLSVESQSCHVPETRLLQAFTHQTFPQLPEVCEALSTGVLGQRKLMVLGQASTVQLGPGKHQCSRSRKSLSDGADGDFPTGFCCI